MTQDCIAEEVEDCSTRDEHGNTSCMHYNTGLEVWAKPVLISVIARRGNAKQLHQKTAIFFQRKKMSCLRQDLNPWHTALQMLYQLLFCVDRIYCMYMLYMYALSMFCTLYIVYDVLCFSVHRPTGWPSRPPPGCGHPEQEYQDVYCCWNHL